VSGGLVPARRGLGSPSDAPRLTDRGNRVVPPALRT